LLLRQSDQTPVGPASRQLPPDAEKRCLEREVGFDAVGELLMQVRHELPRRLGVSVPQADDERTGASVEKRQIQADPLLAHDFSVPDTLGALPQRTCAERDDGRVQFRGKQLTPANHVTAEPEAAIQRAVREEAAMAGEVKDAKLRCRVLHAEDLAAQVG
jgi:hypothetical protein